MSGLGRRGVGQRRLVLRQRFVPPHDADAVHVPLGQDGPQPGRETAASMEIPEQRARPVVLSIAQAEQLGVQGIGELPRVAAGIDGLGGTIEQRPIVLDEMVPRRLVSASARGRQRQVGEVQRVEIPGRLARVGGPSGECVGDAAVESGAEVAARQSPPGRLRLLVERVRGYFAEYCFRSSSSRFARYSSYSFFSAGSFGDP